MRLIRVLTIRAELSPQKRARLSNNGVKQSFKLYGQANKRIRWMPRQLEAMKDVVACDKLGGAGKQALYPEMSEWGNPALRGYLHLNT